MFSPLLPTGPPATKPKNKNKQKRYNSPVLVKETKRSTPKQVERPRPNIKHYLAIKMDLYKDNETKCKRKVSPSMSLEDFHRADLGYEYRTVNSPAEMSLNASEPEVAEEEPRMRAKKQKTGYIDSEVDLMRTLPTDNTVAKTQYLSVIEEHENNDGRDKKLKKRKKKQTPTPTSSESNKVSSAKIKKLSSNISKQQSGGSGLHSHPSDKYPILKNEELVQKFLKVTFTNNQKGRIRQVIKDILQGTSATILPDVINNKIHAILKSSENLTDADLRKIRVLYNMLKKATEDIKKMSEVPLLSKGTLDDSKDSKPETEHLNNKDIKPKNKGDVPKGKGDVPKGKGDVPKGKGDVTKANETKSASKGDKQKSKEDAPKKEKKKLSVKRYVVFLGNLPIDVTREQIFEHFSDIREYIKDVRLPQLADNKRSSFAYVEFDNAPVYEMALARHHSMMGKKRINVLYTTPNKNSKITKSEVKAKTAKLSAMAKKGQLAGSIPLQRKRSHRRAKAKAYRLATEQAERELNSMTLN